MPFRPPPPSLNRTPSGATPLQAKDTANTKKEASLSPEDEEIAEKYRKMLRMGMPDGAVTNKMNMDGVTQHIQDAVLSASAPHPEPEKAAVEESVPLTAEEEEVAEKYRRMLRMGMPEGAVVNKMNMDEVDKRIRDAVLPPEEPASLSEEKTSGNEPSTVPTDNEKGTENSEEQKAPPLSPEEEEVAQKYRKMLTMGMPEGAVANKMNMDGIEQRIQDAVVAPSVVEPEEEKQSSVPPEQNSEKDSEAASPKPTQALSPEDEEVAEQYRKMLQMGMPEGAVAHKMSMYGVEQHIQDAVLSPSEPAVEPVPDATTENPTTVDSTVAAEAPAEPTAASEQEPANLKSKALSPDDEEIAEQYRKMLRMGMPEGAVANKMEMYGVEQHIRDAVLPPKETDTESELNDAPAVGHSGSPTTDAVPSGDTAPEKEADYAPTIVPLTPEEEETAERYRKMIKMGMPEGAVTQKMAVDEVPQNIQEAVINPPPEKAEETTESIQEKPIQENEASPTPSNMANGQIPSEASDDHQQQDGGEEKETGTVHSENIEGEELPAPSQRSLYDETIYESETDNEEEEVIDDETIEDDIEDMLGAKDGALGDVEKETEENNVSARAHDETEDGNGWVPGNQQSRHSDSYDEISYDIDESHEFSAREEDPAPHGTDGFHDEDFAHTAELNTDAHDERYDEEMGTSGLIKEKGTANVRRRRRIVRKNPDRCFHRLVFLAYVLMIGGAVAVCLVFMLDDDDSKGISANFATTPFDPINNGSCDFTNSIQPHVIDQCRCTGQISIIADDVRVRYERNLNNFIPLIYQSYEEPIESCMVRNQALVWLSSSNDYQFSEVQRSERYALAAMFVGTSGGVWTQSTSWLSESTVCTWFGVSCVDGRVDSLTLSSNNASGEIPAEIIILQQLSLLSLSQNAISGEIPQELFFIPTLTGVFLNENKMTGSIPETIQEATALQQLNLESNSLSGSIPTEISLLERLESLKLGDNRLTGLLPPSLFSLRSLKDFEAHTNELEGPIPAAISQASSLRILDLSSNLLLGSVPSSLGSVSTLERVLLRDLFISGQLPDTFTGLTNMMELVISNTDISGSIPSSFGGMTKLETLILSDNEMQGEIPSELEKLTSLTYLDLSSNSLSGTLPTALGGLEFLAELRLHDNALTGSVPSEFGGLVALESFLMDGNILQGTVPTQVCNLRSGELEQLVVDCAAIVCPIPACCTSCRG